MCVCVNIELEVYDARASCVSWRQWSPREGPSILAGDLCVFSDGVENIFDISIKRRHRRGGRSYYHRDIQCVVSIYV